MYHLATLFDHTDNRIIVGYCECHSTYKVWLVVAIFTYTGFWIYSTQSMCQEAYNMEMDHELKLLICICTNKIITLSLIDLWCSALNFWLHATTSLVYSIYSHWDKKVTLRNMYSKLYDLLHVIHNLPFLPVLKLVV